MMVVATYIIGVLGNISCNILFARHVHEATESERDKIRLHKSIDV